MHVARLLALIAALSTTADAGYCWPTIEALDKLARENGVETACGHTGTALLMAESSFCLKPGCLEAIESLFGKVPECIYDFTMLDSAVRAVAKMCEKESATNATTASSSSSGSTDTVVELIPYGECKLEQHEALWKVGNSTAMLKACGTDMANIRLDPAAPQCVNQACNTYISTVVGEYPDCTMKGKNSRTNVKLALEVCGFESAPSAAPVASWTGLLVGFSAAVTTLLV